LERYLHGTDAGASSFELDAFNTGDTELRIVGARAVILTSSPPANYVVYEDAQGGDPALHMGFALDSPNTNAKLVSEGDSADAAPNFFSEGYSVSIEPHRSQVFEVIATTSSVSHDWTITVEYDTSGSDIVRRSTTVYLHDKSPFRTAAVPAQCSHRLRIAGEYFVPQSADAPVVSGPWEPEC
jgi:hypothetical protein